MVMRGLSLLVLCVLFAEVAPGTCEHSGAGEARPVSLAAVRRAQEAVRDRLALAAGRAARVSLETPYASGLPSCAGRRVRAVRARVPRELVGRTIAFAAAERMPAADLRVATSAGSLAELRADALADPALAGRLGVRCAPTLVRVRSEEELELVEGP